MANSLNEDVTNKVVILSSEYYVGSVDKRRFLCESGFGCVPFTMGGAIFGTFLSDGEKCRVEGYQIERLCESS
jgi:hypothetical protein